MKNNPIFVLIFVIATAFADVIETPVKECTFDKDQCNGFPLNAFEPEKFELAKSILINPVTGISLSDYTSISAPTENGLTCRIPYMFSGRNHYYCQARPEFDCITENGEFAKCADGRFLLARIANESTPTNLTFIINPIPLQPGQYNVRFRLFFFCDGVTTNCILAKEYIGVNVNNVYYKYNNSQSNTVSTWKPQIISVDLKISSIKIVLNFVREMPQNSVRSFLGFDDLAITRLDPTTTKTTTTTITTTATTIETTSSNASTRTPNLTQTTTEATFNSTQKIDDNQTRTSKLQVWQIALIVIGIVIIIVAFFAAIKFRKPISEKLKKLGEKPEPNPINPDPIGMYDDIFMKNPTKSSENQEEHILTEMIDDNSIKNLWDHANKISGQLSDKESKKKDNNNDNAQSVNVEKEVDQKDINVNLNEKHGKKDITNKNVDTSDVENLKNV